MTISGSSGLIFPDGSGQETGIGRNRIINGDMVIDQRNAGASYTPTGAAPYCLDRWKIDVAQSSKLTVQQNAGSVTPPAGFTNYLGVTSSSAYSIGASDYFVLRQVIEGYNIADLAWGTANAKTVTVSFWVRSSLTGTFGGALLNNGVNRAYPFTYTISSANTWEQKTITVAGDTSGTWLSNNGIGMFVQFGLGVGSTYSGTAGAWEAAYRFSATGGTSVVGTNGATFYITGVQLERNTTATPFEWLPYTTELQLCQRYYSQAVRGGYPGAFSMTAYATAGATCSLQFPVTMRASPTLLMSFSGTANAVGHLNTGATVAITPAQTWWSADGVLGQQPAGAPFAVGMSYGFNYTSDAEL